jgi:ferredoxin
MATVITSDCINCGACEPECPNTAIYAGGVQWDLNGAKSAAISQDYYYIVPSKCTECVGFFDHEACAAVCPVDCCVPDPKIPETEAVLIARAKELHPGEAFPDDFPSRFRKLEAAAPASPRANGAAANGTAAAPAPAAGSAPAAIAASAAPPGLAPTGVEFDPLGWAVPVICKDCHERFTIPYRYFQVGVVFYCPQCSGSFVPNSTLYKKVRATFEGFYAKRRAEREANERKRVRELELFERKQKTEMEQFEAELEKLAQEMKPAGKMVRPKGIAAMFT